MRTSFSKLVIVMAVNFIISVPIYAKVVEQKELNFPVKIEDLLKGEVHYFFSILSPRKMSVQFPDLYELDSLTLHQEKNIELVVTKSLMVVDKPAGFFDEKQMTDEKYLSNVLDSRVIKEEDQNLYEVMVPGKEGYDYEMKIFFDADDVSTSPNSKVIRAVTAAKKLDVISQSASTIMVTEKTNFTRYTRGGVAVTSFVPVKENKTLIITYQLWAIKNSVNKNAIKASFLNEAQNTRNLLESFKGTP